MVKPKIKGNVNFEIKSQFMRELREDTFPVNKGEDAYDHIDQGPIPGMRPGQALTAIQTMADHSQKWHDKTTSRNIRSSSSKDGLKESVHEIQVGCQNLRKTSPRQGLSPKRGRTSEDEDDIEGIIDYLEPPSYDGFIDLDEEEYNKRRCRLLGMLYIEPIQKLGGNYQDWLDSKSCGNFAESASVTA
ncbi:hypothetical protein Tco_1357171 [Tanacetum coccineum]